MAIKEPRYRMARLMELYGDTLADCPRALGSHLRPMPGDARPASAVSRGDHLLLYPHNRAWKHMLATGRFASLRG
jgi:hypothetical protein